MPGTTKTSSALKWLVLSLCIGLLAGLSSTLFLVLLNFATIYRENHHWLVLFLPLAGFIIGWIYYRHGANVGRGHNLILDEIHDPKQVIPIRMAPYTLIATLLTHLTGGSAGREGAAVQIGASLSDQLTHLFRLSPRDRTALLIMGAGAAFGTVMGTPWAGVIFGLEIVYFKDRRLHTLAHCLIASWSGYVLTQLLGTPHTHYFRLANIPWSLNTLLCVVFSGVLFGLAARVFVKLTHFTETLMSKILRHPPFRTLLGGAILMGLFAIEGTHRYEGLGIASIQNALEHAAHWSEPVVKAFFSALTIGSGFKGGEFIPIVFMGTTLGSALAVLLHVPVPLLATLGFGAMFAGAANAPITCTVLTMELFGAQLGPLALIACFLSYAVSGSKSIYRPKFQNNHRYKII